MGRPKKGLEMQRGHLTKEQQAEKKLQESVIQTGMEQLKNPPTWLRDTVAKTEWKRLVKQFKALSIISNLDRNNLGAYCNAYSAYLEATKKLKDEELITEYTNKAGATNYIENPLIRIQLKYSEEMRKYSSLLGLSIDSRLKLAAIKLTETKSEIIDDFGDI